MTDPDKELPAKLYPTPASLMWNTIIALATVPLGMFVFSLLGRYFFLAELLSNFRCQIMFLLIPFAVILLGVRRSWFSFLVLGAMCWSMLGIAWIYLPGFQPDPGPEKLKVMSYNVLGPNSRQVEAIKQIRDVDPDVLVVLEYSGNWPQALTCLDENYPYRVLEPRWHGFGVAIFSKHPLTDPHTYKLTKEYTDNPFPVATVNFRDQLIRIAGIHVLSPMNRYRMDLRNQQFREAGECLLENDIPTIVVGDFNCTPWSAFLSDFLTQTSYRDSRQGFGYQASWPHARIWPAQIPIDHAFVSHDIHVHSRVVGEHCGSDHRPITLEISTAKVNRD